MPQKEIIVTGSQSDLAAFHAFIEGADKDAQRGRLHTTGKLAAAALAVVIISGCAAQPISGSPGIYRSPMGTAQNSVLGAKRRVYDAQSAAYNIGNITNQISTMSQPSYNSNGAYGVGRTISGIASIIGQGAALLGNAQRNLPVSPAPRTHPQSQTTNVYPIAPGY